MGRHSRIALCALASLCTLSLTREARASPCMEPRSEYAIVVDGGSTGSRLYVFNITYSKAQPMVTSIQGPKAKPGLSSFVGEVTEDKVTEHLMSLFAEARTLIPPAMHAATRTFIKATAGMRLTSEENQARTYDQIYDGLSQHPDFPFHIAREDIGTISGTDESNYAVLSVNYLAGRVAGDLSDTGIGKLGPLGALDMGGGSTQMIFEPRSARQPSRMRTTRLSTDTFWSHSYLGYGVDQIRLKLWSFLATEHKAQARTRRMRAADAAAAAAADTGVQDGSERSGSAVVFGAPAATQVPGPSLPEIPVVHNPCGFRGQVQHWDAVDLQGTGDAEACASLLRRLVWGPSCQLPAPKPSLAGPALSSKAAALVQGAAAPRDSGRGEEAPVHPPCPMDGRTPPPTAGTQWVAMSVYFYALHSAFTLVGEQAAEVAKMPEKLQDALDTWPRPSLRHLRVVADAFCGVGWGDLRDLPKHQYTARDQLSHRCVEVNWIVELLQSGFALSPDARNVTYALEVAGMEVEWTLGFVLSFVSQRDVRRTCRGAAGKPEKNGTSDLENSSVVPTRGLLAAEATT